jgi:hypothetical protein
LAWNGASWSDYQPQRAIANFIDPETLDVINLQCQDAAMSGGYLYVLGCDPANSGDIWFTSRLVGDIGKWFPDPSRWSEPEGIVRGEFIQDSFRFVADSTGQVHAFWNQVTYEGLDPIISIFYALWNGEIWSQPVELLKSQTEKALLRDVAVSPEGILFVLWDSGEPEGLYLSRVSVQGNALELVTSDPLITLQQYAVSPEILLDSEENIIISFAIPLNEGRGIYLIRSMDNGRTWSDPIQIADAYSLGWEMVDHPKMVRTENGDLLMIWMVYALLPDPEPVSLFSARSQDDGLSWSDIEMVYEGGIVWSDIIRADENTIHRFWQENNRTERLMHQISSDGGSNWAAPENISAANENILSIATYRDESGRVHLFQLTRDSHGNHRLHHWTWDGSRWQANDRLDIGTSFIAQPGTLAAIITRNGTLGIFFNSSTVEGTGEAQQINFVKRQLELLPVEAVEALTPTPVRESTATPMPVEAPTLIPTLLPTPQHTLEPSVTTVLPEPSGESSSQSTWIRYAAGGIILSIVMVVVIVLVVKYKRA